MGTALRCALSGTQDQPHARPAKLYTAVTGPTRDRLERLITETCGANPMTAEPETPVSLTTEALGRDVSTQLAIIAAITGLLVDKGLLTADEVAACLGRLRSADRGTASQRPLDLLLLALGRRQQAPE